MNSKQLLGKRGEELAQKYLKDNQYTILDVNFECVFGEVDIVAMKNNEIIFVEVKTRAQEFFGTPAEAITSEKKKHIYKVSQFYLCKNKICDISISLDVIEVYLYQNQPPRIFHFKNAILEAPSRKF